MATAEELRAAIRSSDVVAVINILKKDASLVISSIIRPPRFVIFTDPMTPLMYAVVIEAPAELMSAIIMSGADVVNDRWQGASLLHYVSNEGHIDLLVENGLPIDVKNSRGQTPLFPAILSSKQGLVRRFVSMGADLESRDRDGLTPLLCAIRGGEVSIASLLISLGADLTSRTNTNQSLHDLSVERVEYLSSIARLHMKRMFTCRTSK